MRVEKVHELEKQSKAIKEKCLNVFRASLFHSTEIKSLFLPTALLDLPRGLLKCVMFRKPYGCPHDDIRFVLYTP